MGFHPNRILNQVDIQWLQKNGCIFWLKPVEQIFRNDSQKCVLITQEKRSELQTDYFDK